jgi:hypothetical protein
MMKVVLELMKNRKLSGDEKLEIQDGTPDLVSGVLKGSNVASEAMQNDSWPCSIASRVSTNK